MLKEKLTQDMRREFTEYDVSKELYIQYLKFKKENYDI